MKAINHYTLNTKHMRVSLEDEIHIDKDIYFRFIQIINNAKEGKTHFFGDKYIYITEDEFGYMCTIYVKFFDDYIPIVTTAGTEKPEGRFYMWDLMVDLMRRGCGMSGKIENIPVEVPYIVDVVFPVSFFIEQDLSWTGGFTRDLGWMMMFPKEMQRNVLKL